MPVAPKWRRHGSTCSVIRPRRLYGREAGLDDLRNPPSLKRTTLVVRINEASGAQRSVAESLRKNEND
jgi:hypothetical protein